MLAGILTMSAPSDRCGFILTETDEDNLSVNQLHRNRIYRTNCCWRETWDGYDRCIWHARVDGKPIDELIESRTGHPENLDGAYLKRTVLAGAMSFQNCSLNGANFDGCFADGVNFSEIRSNSASFKNSNISYCNFTKSILIDCDFNMAHGQILSFQNSSVYDCDFSGAIVDGNFSHSDIWGCEFSGSDGGIFDFTGARVISTDFSDLVLLTGKFIFADMANCDFSGSDISGADMYFSIFTRSKFKNTTISDSDLRFSAIEDCDFTSSVFTRSDFRFADIYRCSFDNVQLDRSTEFGSHYLTSSRPIINVGNVVSLNSLWANQFENWGSENEHKLLEKRIWVLRSLQDLFSRNSMTDKSRDFYIKRRDAERNLARVSNDWIDWFFQSSQKYLMGYGENPYYVVIWSFLTILLFSVAYAMNGGVDQLQLDWFYIDILFVRLEFTNDSLLSLIESLYFSGLTFSSLGYGDVQPATWTVRLLATAQSLLGVLLTSLFVFVLGRRTAR